MLHFFTVEIGGAERQQRKMLCHLTNNLLIMDNHVFRAAPCIASESANYAKIVIQLSFRY